MYKPRTFHNPALYLHMYNFATITKIPIETVETALILSLDVAKSCSGSVSYHTTCSVVCRQSFHRI